MNRKRWKLAALWAAAVVLAIIAAGTGMYLSARTFAEKIALEVPDVKPGPGYETDVTFRGVNFSREWWIEIDFVIAARSVSPAKQDFRYTIARWTLR